MEAELRTDFLLEGAHQHQLETQRIMRWDCLLLLAALGSTGCAGNRSSEFPMSKDSSRPPTKKPSAPIVTPSVGRAGKIASVHSAGHFVVITFPVGIPLPPAERRLNVYRAGLKVAEVKVNALSIDVNTVADIVMGTCEIGDEVREN